VRRLVRVIFCIVAAASLLLCVAAIGMWVRSHRISERWVWSSVRSPDQRPVTWDVNVWSSSGGVGIYVIVYDDWQVTPVWPPYHDGHAMRMYPYVPVPELAMGRSWSVAGMTIYHEPRRPLVSMDIGESNLTAAQYTLILPYWLMATMTAPLPLLWVRSAVIRRQRRRRQRLGLCSACGYDLRASAGRCPECGADPAR
jgi:hypothetical protein